MTVSVPEGPVHVRVAPGDLAAAVDALLENVFAHTKDGVAFEVRLEEARASRPVTLTVTDHGAGFGDRRSGIVRGDSNSGSTGLGMDIVRRTAEASGGSLLIEDTGRGARVVAQLGSSTRTGDARS